MIPTCPKVATTISFDTQLEMVREMARNSTKDIEGDPDCPKCDYFRGLRARCGAELKSLRTKITLSLKLQDMSRELQDMKDDRKIPSVSYIYKLKLSILYENNL